MVTHRWVEYGYVRLDCINRSNYSCNSLLGGIIWDYLIYYSDVTTLGLVLMVCGGHSLGHKEIMDLDLVLQPKSALSVKKSSGSLLMENLMQWNL